MPAHSLGLPSFCRTPLAHSLPTTPCSTQHPLQGGTAPCPKPLSCTSSGVPQGAGRQSDGTGHLATSVHCMGDYREDACPEMGRKFQCSWGDFCCHGTGGLSLTWTSQVSATAPAATRDL